MQDSAPRPGRLPGGPVPVSREAATRRTPGTRFAPTSSASSTDTIITVSSTERRLRCGARSSRIDCSQAARRGPSSIRPVIRPCARSSDPSALPTTNIPTGSPTRISTYGPIEGCDESVSAEASQISPSGSPTHITTEPAAMSSTSTIATGLQSSFWRRVLTAEADVVAERPMRPNVPGSPRDLERPACRT